MSKGSRSRITDKKRFSRNWPFGHSRRKPGSGTYVLRAGKLVPVTKADIPALRKRDSKNIVSVAAGVQAVQVPQAEHDVAEAGLSGVKYRPDGDAVFDDRHAKLRFLKHAGMHDKDEVRG